MEKNDQSSQNEKEKSELKEKLEETSEEIKKMKMSSTATQNEIREMSNQFADIVDEVRAFKEEVFDRCQEYVKHAAQMEQKFIVLNKKEEANINTIQEMKTEVKESIDIQEQAISVYASNMKNYYDHTTEWMLDQKSQHARIEDLSSKMTDLRMWQIEIENSHGNIKTEEANDASEPEDEETENANESEGETEDEQNESTNQPEAQEKSVKSIAQRNKQIKYDWYEFSIDWMPDDYKFQYVHSNADSRNKKKVYAWYKDCDRLQIIPETYQLIPGEEEEEPEKAEGSLEEKKINQNNI